MRMNQEFIMLVALITNAVVLLLGVGAFILIGWFVMMLVQGRL